MHWLLGDGWTWAVFVAIHLSPIRGSPSLTFCRAGRKPRPTGIAFVTLALGLTGLIWKKGSRGVKEDSVEPRVDCFSFSYGPGVIVLAVGKRPNTGHRPLVTSCMVSNHLLAKRGICSRTGRKLRHTSTMCELDAEVACPPHMTA